MNTADLIHHLMTQAVHNITERTLFLLYSTTDDQADYYTRPIPVTAAPLPLAAILEQLTQLYISTSPQTRQVREQFIPPTGYTGLLARSYIDRIDLPEQINLQLPTTPDNDDVLALGIHAHVDGPAHLYLMHHTWEQSQRIHLEDLTEPLNSVQAVQDLARTLDQHIPITDQTRATSLTHTSVHQIAVQMTNEPSGIYSIHTGPDGHAYASMAHLEVDPTDLSTLTVQLSVLDKVLSEPKSVAMVNSSLDPNRFEGVMINLTTPLMDPRVEHALSLASAHERLPHPGKTLERMQGELGLHHRVLLVTLDGTVFYSELDTYSHIRHTRDQTTPHVVATDSHHHVHLTDPTGDDDIELPEGQFVSHILMSVCEHIYRAMKPIDHDQITTPMPPAPDHIQDPDPALNLNQAHTLATSIALTHNPGLYLLEATVDHGVPTTRATLIVPLGMPGMDDAAIDLLGTLKGLTNAAYDADSLDELGLPTPDQDTRYQGLALAAHMRAVPADAAETAMENLAQGASTEEVVRVMAQEIPGSRVAFQVTLVTNDQRQYLHSTHQPDNHADTISHTTTDMNDLNTVTTTEGGRGPGKPAAHYAQALPPHLTPDPEQTPPNHIATELAPAVTALATLYR